MIRWGSVFFGLFVANSAVADTVNVAVAAHFADTAEQIAEAFEGESGHKVVFTTGSTGALLREVEDGASFDVLLSGGDTKGLRRAEVFDQRIYAVTRLVLVSISVVDPENLQAATSGKRIVLADPTATPLGRQSTRAMELLRLNTAEFQPLMVANVAQAATVFADNAAEFAFLDAAALNDVPSATSIGFDGQLPDVQQSAALLSNSTGARAFWDFLAAEQARNIIAADGYQLP